MSYILDALKRADSERERGAVPGLHAQPAAALAASAAEQQPRTLPWVVIGSVVVLGLLILLAWRWLAPRETAAPALPPVAVVPVAPAAPAPAAVPVPVVPAPAPARAPDRVQAQAPAPSPRAAEAPPLAAAPVQKAAEPPARTSLPAASPAPSTAPSTAPSSPATSPPAERVYSLQELPEDIRRQLPALAVTGAVHSNDPAQRMLIVNGQVVQEGGQPAPEVALLQIGPKAAVLGFKGYRFSIGY